MFKFQLEPVLSLKEKFEESKKRELGAEIQKQNVILSERTALLHNQHALLDEMKAQSIQTVHVNELKLCGHYAKALEKAIEVKNKEAEMAQKRVEEKREELIKAMRERKILDNLKEIKKEQYRDEERHAEAQFLDEIVSYKYGAKEGE